MMTQAETKIIEATVESIEKYGLQGTTIRKIGEIASMNSASINYYFRSKDVLIQKVLEITLQNAFQWEDFAYTEKMTYEDQLNEILVFFIEGSFKFPKVTQAHFHDIVMNGKYDGLTASVMNAFLDNVFEEGRRKHPEVDSASLRYALVNLFSSTVLYFGFFSKLFDPFTQRSLLEPVNYLEYVKQSVHSMLMNINAI